MADNIKKEKYAELTHPRFMEFRCEYKQAKYVFNPILFERDDAFIKGVANGPSAILEASHVIEKYHIGTDSKAYLSGFATTDPFFAMSEEECIHQVNKVVTQEIADKKIPITLLGDGSGSIGAYYALNKVANNVTILSLDAHLSLRETMGGTRNHRLCRMHHAKVCSENVLHFGVASMGNNEKFLFDPDKVFFAEDIVEDKYWLEDVLCEISGDVYISLDMSVFSPGIIGSLNPDPGGLCYRTIEKLLRSVVQKHHVIGIDISGFVPDARNRGGELILAKLIYDIVSYIDAKS